MDMKIYVRSTWQFATANQLEIRLKKDLERIIHVMRDPKVDAGNFTLRDLAGTLGGKFNTWSPKVRMLRHAGVLDDSNRFVPASRYGSYIGRPLGSSPAPPVGTVILNSTLPSVLESSTRSNGTPSWTDRSASMIWTASPF